MCGMGQDKFLTVRIPAGEHAELRKLAKRNDRTVAAEVRVAIRDRLNAEKQETTA